MRSETILNVNDTLSELVIHLRYYTLLSRSTDWEKMLHSRLPKLAFSQQSRSSSGLTLSTASQQLCSSCHQWGHI